MTKEQEAFKAWKQADAQARALEVLLAATWEEVMNRTGPPPTEEMLGEVSRLRALANEKLTVVMAMLRTAVARHRCSPASTGSR